MFAVYDQSRERRTLQAFRSRFESKRRQSSMQETKVTAAKLLAVLRSVSDALLRTTGVLAALAAIAAVVLPTAVWKPIEARIATLYGTTGWVYYEVGENRTITNDGNFYLLKETPTGYYEEIDVGDKLRVSGDVNFRSEQGKNAPRSFVLIKGDCVIVIDTPADPVDVRQAKSGGWLNVATSPCGLF